MFNRRRRRVLVAGSFSVATALLAAACNASPAPSPAQAQPWALQWSDEFSGSVVDPAKWRVENNSTFGDGNNELACLTRENVTVSGGNLQITANRFQTPHSCGGQDNRFPNGRDYGSGMLTTKGIASWTYGKIEVRAKLPTNPGRSQGLWPAIWMRPVDGGSGELDIMEAIGTGPGGLASEVSQTAWYDKGGHNTKTSRLTKVPSGSTNAFHTYAVEWTPGHLAWSIDGQVTFEASGAEVAKDFARPYFLRLNLAVGGKWPGDPTGSTMLPQSMDVDYVRVYEHSGTPDA